MYFKFAYLKNCSEFRFNYISYTYRTRKWRTGKAWVSVSLCSLYVQLPPPHIWLLHIYSHRWWGYILYIFLFFILVIFSVLMICVIHVIYPCRGIYPRIWIECSMKLILQSNTRVHPFVEILIILRYCLNMTLLVYIYYM